MTSLDFKALLKKERASILRQAVGDSGSNHNNDGGNDDGSNPLLSLEPRSPLDWRASKVPGPVDGIHYVPGWLSEHDAQQLLTAINRAPAASWSNLNNRRLQNLGGTPAAAGAGKGMRPVPVPHYCQAVFRALVAAGVFAASSPPNHILLNEYSHGQGIAPHKDGPLYQNRVAIVSLGSPAVLEFWDCGPSATGGGMPPSCVSVAVAPRSLLVFEGDAYENYWHGILRLQEAQENDTRRRVSLTVRRVLEVCAEDKEVLETAESQREERRKDAQFLQSISDDR